MAHLDENALAAKAWADLEFAASATGALEVANVTLPTEKVRALVNERSALPSSPVSDLVERLNLPWPPDGSGDEVTLPVWAIELMAEAASKLTTLTHLSTKNAELEAENARLRQINANLMGDDEDTPRYTTKRLKQEIAKATDTALEATPPTSELEAENASLRSELEYQKKVSADRWETTERQAYAFDDMRIRAEAAEARLAEAMKTLEEAREVVDACAGDNRPARGWAVTVRDGIDAVLAARRVREGGKVDG